MSSFIVTLLFLKKQNLHTKLSVVLLLIAFVTQSFNRFLIVGDYYIQTENYTARCENKAAPQLHCNGKCQMMKKLQKEEEKDHQNPAMSIDNKFDCYFFPEEPFNLASSFFLEINLNSQKWPVENVSGWPDSVFHPPAV